ncbi:MAG: hypothetical protein JO186_00655 [Actinobacteria bacterium]|nr:hypothetical protein [Actinomycetota bacterium]MBV8396440.1 hypothetical protein [Actinomycetota bacterium]
MRMTRSKWFLPGFAVALGLVAFAAQWVGGHAGSGLVSLAIMTVFAAFVLAGGRSETIRGLRGDGRDERFREIDVRATAFAGLALIVAVIVASLVELARNRNPAPYDWLAAVAGVTYIAAVVALRVRG